MVSETQTRRDEMKIPRTHLGEGDFAMKDIITKARQSQEFPDSDWLKSVGFTMSEAKHAHVATITIGSFDGWLNRGLRLAPSWFACASHLALNLGRKHKWYPGIRKLNGETK